MVLATFWSFIVTLKRLSLRKLLLLWLIPPIFLMSLAWAGATYYVVLHFANLAYDHELEDSVLTLSGQLKNTKGIYSISLSPASRQMLEFDALDRVYFNVNNANGQSLVGNRELPLHPRQALNKTCFYDDVIDGRRVRIGEYALSDTNVSTQVVHVQVAETIRKRENMARAAVLYMVVPQIVFISGITLFLWLGIGRGVEPLTRISQALAKRNHEDLSPIKESGLPTEVNEQVKAINSLMGRLEKVIHEQRRFIADATHQLRTPITVLKTTAEMAMRIKDPVELVAAVSKIEAACSRLARMANQLLSLSRAEAGLDKRLIVEHLNLVDIMQDVVARLIPLALNKKVEVRINIANSLIEITGDKQMLEEMLANLVDNAIRYTPTGGNVEVSVKKMPGNVAISVTDNGPGIGESDRGKVLERFYRVNGTNVEGSGLGLSIAREIAWLHKGEIELADGASGTGLSVTVKFFTDKISK